MIFTDELVAQIRQHTRAVLSLTGPSGYPVALPLSFTFDPESRCFAMPIPKNLPNNVPRNGLASLTLLRYDPQVANERWLLFHGRLVESPRGFDFYPSRMVAPQWGRR